MCGILSASMRYIIKSNYFVYLLLGLALFTGAEAGAAYSESFSTGKDWVQKMSKGEKFISVYAPMILFHRYGINFQKTPDEYVNTMDRVLINNPYLEKEDVANIFASTVYAYEPESRRAFKLMELEFARQDLVPRLAVKRNLNPEVNQTSEDN